MTAQDGTPPRERRDSMNTPSPTVLIEAAVDSFDGAMRAQAASVQRIELCGPLHDGGTTPSAGLIARVTEKILVSVNVLIRPRAGNFVYGADELEIMKKDIVVAKELGVDGFAFGALTPDGDVDIEQMAELIHLATPLRVVFHRAFDSLRDQDEALELLVSLQVNGVLTSGGAKTAAGGAERIRHLVERAERRIRVIAAGSITAATVASLVHTTGVSAVHGRAVEGMASALRA
ncbi:MAG: copper homeostasis protein CutC [Gemmatimonadetes bacterium]|nr:MAG: copper homeostasis protein CutC [Gemmatimonadota bacterium]